MAVYVDDMRAEFGRMVMCHMACNSQDLNELHAMADRIGVRGKWFQNKVGFPHYDICISKKKLAIEFGAHQTTQRELLRMLQNVWSREKE